MSLSRSANWLSPIDSVESAVAAILGLAADAPLRAGLSAAARLHASRAYSFERIALEIATMYLDPVPAARPASLHPQ